MENRVSTGTNLPTLLQRRVYFISGLLVLLLLVFVAVKHYRERTIFLDAAFQQVYYLAEGKPYYMPVRISAVIYQYLPILAVKAGASLKTVLVANSICSLTIFIALYIFSFIVFKKSLSFLLYPMVLMLFANDVFYWPVPDTQLGLIWLSLYCGFLFDEQWIDKKWAWPAHVFLMAWVQMMHLLMAIPIFFVLLYYYEKRSALWSRAFYTHSTIAAVLAFGRLVIAWTNNYERGRTVVWVHMFERLPHLTQLYSVQMFFGRAQNIYAIYLLSLAGVVVHLLYRRKLFLAALTAGSTFFMWLLIVASYPDDLGIYIENLLMPIGFFVALPLTTDLLPELALNKAAPVVVLASLLRIYTISETHKVFEERHKIFDPYFAYVRKHHLNGLIVDEKLVADKRKYYLLWATGYESMLLSSLNAPDSCIIVQFDEDLGMYKYAKYGDTMAATKYAAWGRSVLPSKYFKLQGKPYELIADSNQLKK